MQKFPRSVLGFYFKNMYRYAKLWPLVFALFSAFDTAGHTVIPAFFIKAIISCLEGVPAGEAFMSVLPIAIVYFFVRATLVSGAILRWVVFDNKIRYRAYNAISKDLYDYVFSQSVDFYTSSMPGKINSQVDGVANGFFEIMNMVWGNAVATMSAFLLGFGGLFVIGWQYLLVIGVGLAGRIIWGLCKVRRVITASANAARAQNHLQGRLLDALSNFLVVKTFARANYEQRCAAPFRKDYEKLARIGHARSRIFWGPGNAWMDVFAMTSLMLLCGYMYSRGLSTVADISFALSVFVGMSSLSFMFIMDTKNFIEKWGRSVGSYNELIRSVRVNDAPNASELNVRHGVIEFRDVNFKYGRKNVLHDLSFKIKPGEKVGIVGASGAGKTTLVNLILRLYDTTRGGIYIDGVNIKDVTQESLRQSIAFIPQDATMFNRTIYENIAYGRLDADMSAVRRAAHRASADKFIQTTPEKYETLVGDRGIKLSGGQRQRIAIARAFLKDAPILILDEATSALDSETETAIQESFADLSKGRTTLVIAHRLSTLRNMDRIIVLDKGNIIESGTHKSLLRHKGLYRRLWNMQSGGFLAE